VNARNITGLTTPPNSEGKKLLRRSGKRKPSKKQQKRENMEKVLGEKRVTWKLLNKREKGNYHLGGGRGRLGRVYPNLAANRNS